MSLFFVQHTDRLGYLSFDSVDKATEYARRRLSGLPRRKSFPIYSYENGKRYLYAKVLRLDRN
jgi:hypothetical protein